MSAFGRVQQWATFARTWHLYDATWQNPFDSALVLIKYLQGLHKPIYHPMSKFWDCPVFSEIISLVDRCGDHLVVLNCKDIALPGEEWKKRVYFHHTGYPGGASWTMAWELHEKDPTMVKDYLNREYFEHTFTDNVESNLQCDERNIAASARYAVASPLRRRGSAAGCSQECNKSN